MIGYAGYAVDVQNLFGGGKIMAEDVKTLALIESAKKGNEKDFELLVEKYKKIAHTFKVNVDSEEKEHLASIGIFYALKRFEPKRDNKFSTFVWQYIRWLILEHDALMRTGKKIDVIVFGAAPKLSKCSVSNIKSLHQVLFKLNIVKTPYNRYKDSLKRIQKILNSVTFYNDHRSLFKSNLSKAIQKDIECYDNKKAWCSLILTPNMKKRIQKMNFFLLNSLSSIYCEDAFSITSESEFSEENNILSNIPSDSCDIDLFLDDNLFAGLDKREMFVINYLHNYCSIHEKDIIDSTHKIGVLNQDEVKAVIIENVDVYKIVGKVLDVSPSEVKKIEKSALKKIKQNMKKHKYTKNGVYIH